VIQGAFYGHLFLARTQVNLLFNKPLLEVRSEIVMDPDFPAFSIGWTAKKCSLGLRPMFWVVQMGILG